MADTFALANMTIYNNATWADAFQFGDPTDTSWSFSGCSFRLDVKGDEDDATALLSVTSGAGEIAVDDVTLRILHMNVPEATITGALIPGKYEYDLIMTDVSGARIGLLRGRLHVKVGITGG